jgi:hypothetical protein
MHYLTKNAHKYTFNALISVLEVTAYHSSAHNSVLLGDGTLKMGIELIALWSFQAPKMAFKNSSPTSRRSCILSVWDLMCHSERQINTGVRQHAQKMA